MPMVPEAWGGDSNGLGCISGLLFPGTLERYSPPPPKKKPRDVVIIIVTKGDA